MRARRNLLLALLPVVLISLGAPCGGSNTISLAGPSSVAPLTLFTIDVVVKVDQPIHAYEFAVEWDPTLLWGLGALPDPAFDDDGSFFVSPSLTLGKLEAVVDLRHGGAGASGTFPVAQLRFFSFNKPGSAIIVFTDGGVASATGDPVPIIPLAAAVTVAP